jgi:hypothetical protein
MSSTITPVPNATVYMETPVSPSPQQNTIGRDEMHRLHEQDFPRNIQAHQKVKAWPWITFFLFLYVFILVWINYAIVQRYWILHNWNEALPGLDKTSLRKFTMRSHMTAGAMALLLGPIQFLLRLPVLKGCPNLQIHCHRIHRWSGRIYCICGILSCVFGLWFIALKKRLVGGYNMTASFALAGCAIGYTSFRAWQTARAINGSSSSRISSSSSNNNTNNIHSRKTSRWLVQQHRNWGIRSFAQILAPALYRYWYTMMELFHIYNVPVPLGMGGYCGANDLCPDYMRGWDSVYTWLYWISAGVVAEIIIYFLPSHVDSSRSEEMGNGVAVQEQEESGGEDETALSALLLSRSSEEHDDSSQGCFSSSATTNYGSDNGPRSLTRQSPIMTAVVEVDNNDHSSGTPFVVNVVGGLLACVAIATTGATIHAMVKQSSTESR